MAGPARTAPRQLPLEAVPVLADRGVLGARSHSFNGTGIKRHTAALTELAGVADQAQPFDAIATRGAVGSRIAAPAVTTTMAEALLRMQVSLRPGSTARTVAPPASMTELVEVGRPTPRAKLRPSRHARPRTPAPGSSCSPAARRPSSRRSPSGPPAEDGQRRYSRHLPCSLSPSSNSMKARRRSSSSDDSMPVRSSEGPAPPGGW